MQVQERKATELKSAFKEIEEIKAKIKGRQPAVFLDYDGTLAPIVEDPAKAHMDESMRQVLRDLAKNCVLSVISGRDKKVVQDFVLLDNILYAGSHGFDISGPNGMEMESQEAMKIAPAFDDVEQELQKKVGDIKGIIIERKKFALAVHYRNVEQQHVNKIKETIDDVLHEFPALHTGKGKMVIEIKPAIDWDKGKAVYWIMQELNLNTPEHVPIYIGDDITDEDAFRALAQRNGIGIIVDDHGDPTTAQYRLESVNEVEEFLKLLSKVLEEASTEKD